MTEDWIEKLAKEQRTREQKEAEEQSASSEAQQTFDAAAAPFWEKLQEELRKAVAAYNEALGREDLTIPPEDKRLRRHGNSFEIHRGNWAEEHCRVDLYGRGRKVTAEYRTRPSPRL